MTVHGAQTPAPPTGHPRTDGEHVSGAVVLALPVLATLAVLFVTLLLLVLVQCVAPERANALTYPDVRSSQWARAHIEWVTDQRIGGERLLDDYDGLAFRPARALTRAQLARALVLASRKHTVAFKPSPLTDVPEDHAYHDDIQRALKLGLLGKFGDEFRPDDPALIWQAHRALVKMIRLQYPRADWSMLRTLDPAQWEPNPGFRTQAPRYFAFEVAARYFGLRYNHPAAQDSLERMPTEALRRDHAAFAFYQALHLSSWKVGTLSRFNNVVLPTLSERQKQIVNFAVRFVGYPHIYGGEYPTVDSPYGRQSHGGFDCSGFTWWVMKIHFKYPISVYQRTAAAMAAAAKPRITRAKLTAGDLMFWAPRGTKSSAASVYHAGLYLGNGWFIHSTGSTAGVSLASLNWEGWSWKTDFAWGRRLLKVSQLPPSPSPTPTPTGSPSPSPSTSAP